MERKNAWNTYDEKEKQRLNSLNADYIDFLSECKTERECIQETIKRVEAKGYISLEQAIENNKPLKQGDKIYSVCMNKTVALFNIGKEPMEKGMNILGAHIDSPRMDVKQNPLYENEGMAYLDTHYYGGIKKYQWVTLPLAIHGVIVKKDGTTVNVNIGEKPEDPVFCVTDLLIHLAQAQMEKKAAKVVEGENLDVLIGTIPLNEEEKEATKKAVLNILKEKYDMEEEDFMSAELEVVPAGRAREMGFDRSMIMSYGQDDRVCAYTSLVAMLEVENVEKTTCCLLVDKEEIGYYERDKDGKLTHNEDGNLIYIYPDKKDENGNVTENKDPVLVKKTISKETSDIIKDYMQGVVEEGTGASAAVEGYAVGGKTGTAEKLPRGNGKYLVSFIGYAPQENPQVMVYVVIDEPNSAVQANSGYATQLASQIMTDIFPYLGVEKKDGASDTIETSAEETTTQTAQE